MFAQSNKYVTAGVIVHDKICHLNTSNTAI